MRWEHQIAGFDAYPSTASVLAGDTVYYTSTASSGVVAGHGEDAAEDVYATVDRGGNHIER